MQSLSMEQFKLELEQLSSEGLKFDVKSQGTGNVYLFIPDCNVSVYQENEEICGEIIITKPESDINISLDFDAVIDVLRDDDMFISDGVKYLIEIDSGMFMSDIQVCIEIDIFQKYIPGITEMTLLFSNMDYKEYQSCKQEALKASDERAKPFMEKVFTLIESVIYGNTEKFSLC